MSLEDLMLSYNRRAYKCVKKGLQFAVACFWSLFYDIRCNVVFRPWYKVIRFSKYFERVQSAQLNAVHRRQEKNCVPTCQPNLATKRNT